MIYALAFEIPAQKALIEKVCFGSCGKVASGVAKVDGHMMFLCRAADCPAREDEMEIPFEVLGENVIMRRLKEGE